MEDEQDKKDRPEKDAIKWNQLSIKHRSKIEALSVDPSKEKVGNIYFSRKNKYIINPGGRPTAYLGFSDEYIEVAVRVIETGTMNIKKLKKLLQHVRIHESKNIMKYGLEQEGGFCYLAAELCECDLVDYMTKILNDDTRNAKKAKAVTDILRGLQVLHTAGVIHGALKPSSIFIDSHNTAKLADYGSIYKLKSSTADTQSWEATEILNKTETRHTKKSDIQVAGMLVYYSLSDREHPFGNIKDREENIKKGTYSLEHVEDIVAKDLIEWMINKNPQNRPKIDEVLHHPYFWDDNRKDVVLRILGDREEVQGYRTYYDPQTKDKTCSKNYIELNRVVTKFTTDGIKDWKKKMRSIWGKVDENLPDNLLGLLRFMRNILVHDYANFLKKDMFEEFPEFFIRLHRLAYELKWKY